MIHKWMKQAAVAMAAVFLAACGGGGGGADPGGVPGASVVVLGGSVTFDSVPNTTGALNYAAIAAKPVRGAVVEVLNASQAVLATTTTDANGAYSVSLPSSTFIQVRVKAQMLQSGAGASWDVTVRDNTQSDAIYAMETPTFTSGIGTTTRNVHAPSGWGGSDYSSTRVAAPFAVLDTVYAAQAKVLSVAPATAFPPLRLFWSPQNLPSPGQIAMGQIGTTFFSNEPGGRAIYVLGRENVDTDEYDATVIAHEWGHYYQSALSRDDSPGGGHTLNDLLDRRVAFSEGWGNAWSGIALERTNYTDSSGAAQQRPSSIDLRAGATGTPGWFREASIHSVLWNLNQQVGFKPIHDAFVGPLRTQVAVTSIHPFVAAFNAVAPGSASALNALLAGQAISSAPADPFGVAETNAGGVAGALPMYGSATVGGAVNTVCVSTAAGTGNKLGNHAYLRFSVPSARNYTIALTPQNGPAGSADPDFVVYAGREVARGIADGNSETAVVGLPAGENVLVVNDFRNVAGGPCFNLTIQ